MKQTAVEWVISKLPMVNDNEPYLSEIINQAKEIEKEQTLYFGAKCCLMTTQENDWSLEKLYNETFTEQTRIANDNINVTNK